MTHDEHPAGRRRIIETITDPDTGQHLRFEAASPDELARLIAAHYDVDDQDSTTLDDTVG